MADTIAIADYDAAWPRLYREEAARLLAALPDLVVAIDHFCSTAVPGLAAKPVIDILVGVRSVALARAAVVAPMDALGYAFWQDNPRHDRLFFVKGLPPAPHRTHHVHMAELDGELWRRLPFRDHLRAHPKDAARYATLKRDLAARHATDREAYTAAKTAFVDAILAKAARARRL